MRLLSVSHVVRGQLSAVKGLLKLLRDACRLQLYALLALMFLGAIVPYVRWAAFGPLAAEIAKPQGGTTRTMWLYMVFLLVVWLVELMLKKLIPSVRSHAAQATSSYVPRIRLGFGLSSFQLGDRQQQLHDAEEGEYNLPFVIPEQTDLVIQGLTLLVGVCIVSWFSLGAGATLLIAMVIATSLGMVSTYVQYMADYRQWPLKGEITTTKRFMQYKEAMKPVINLGIDGALVRHIERLASRIHGPIRSANWKMLPVDLAGLFTLWGGFIWTLFTVLGLRGQISTGTVFFLFLTVVSTAANYQRFVESFGRQVLGGEKVRKLFQFLNAPPEVSVADGGEAPPFEEDPVISITNFRFAYPGGDPIFDGISGTIPSNRITYLLGRNGVGKSTLLNALSRLYPIDRGGISIGSKDITVIDPSQLRVFLRHLAQDTLSMRYTIRRTLAFVAGFDDEQQCPEDIMWRALSLACLEKKVRSFPNGLDEPLGSFQKAKVDLSGGEMKKLNIAMFFLAVLSGRTKIVVLDEPFNNIDQESAGIILKNIQDLQVTVIIVTHGVDRIPEEANILFLQREKGSAATLTSGTHGGLLNEDPNYRKLCAIERSQSGNGKCATN